MIMLVIAVIAALAGCTEGARPAPAVGPSNDPGALIEDRTARLSRDGPYRDPAQVERARGRDPPQQLLGHPDNGTDLDAAVGRPGNPALPAANTPNGRPCSQVNQSPT